MKITKVYIENYKSIKSLEFTPSEYLNVFIGENSVGKSNIFDAINWLLGPVYPSFNNVKDEERYLGDSNNKIKIRLHFDDSKYLELAEEWQDYRGNIKSGLNINGAYITDEVRQYYASAYLGVDRKILDYLPSNRWSLLGRILIEINKAFSEETVEMQDGRTLPKPELFKERIEQVRDDLLFSVKDEDGNEIMKDFIRLIQTESARQLNKPESDFSVDLNLYDPWNYYRTLQLLVKEADTGLQFQASTLGMGIQASISIAILKAYSELKLKNKTPIFIDEPELFLHPHAQKNFYNVLRDVATSGTQLFITTHSPYFIPVEHFDEIFVVRKTKERGTFVNCADVNKFIMDFKARTGNDATADDIMLRYKNAFENTGDSSNANVAFFAKKIILVEGQTEALCLPYLFSLTDFDYVKEGISIVRCGNKNEIDRFCRLYIEFGIPCYIIFDGDSHLKGTSDESDNITKNRAVLSMLDVDSDYPDGKVHDLYLGFEKEFELHLGYTTTKKGLDLFIEMKSTITEKSQVPEWVSQVKEKVLALKEYPNSVLREPDESIALEPF